MLRFSDGLDLVRKIEKESEDDYKIFILGDWEIEEVFNVSGEIRKERLLVGEDD